MALKYVFSAELQKSSSGCGLRPPDPHSLWRLGIRPQTPVCDMFELHKFTQSVSQFRRFHFLIFGSSPLPVVKFWLSARHRPRLQIFHSTICLSNTKFLFRKFLMPKFIPFVVCPLPPIKNPGYA